MHAWPAVVPCALVVNAQGTSPLDVQGLPLNTTDFVADFNA